MNARRDSDARVGRNYAKKTMPITAVFVVPAWCSDMKHNDKDGKVTV